MECAVIAAPDREYGQVPWAFVEMRPGRTFNADTLTALMKNSGLAGHKIPTRISDNKIDKKALLARETAP